MAELDPWAQPFSPSGGEESSKEPKSAGIFGSKEVDPWSQPFDPYGSQSAESTTGSKVGGVARAAAATILGAKLFLPTTVASGLYGIGKGAASLLKGEGADKVLEAAQSGVETIPGAINKAILTTPESQSYAETVGGIINWPIEKSRQGWKGIAEYAGTGDITKASDVVTGKSEGSNIAVPITGTLAETNALAALFGRPGFKAEIRETPKASKVSDFDVLNQGGIPATHEVQSRLKLIKEHGAVQMAAQVIGDRIRSARTPASEPTPPPVEPPPVIGKSDTLSKTISDLEQEIVPDEIKGAVGIKKAEAPEEVSIKPPQPEPPIERRGTVDTTPSDLRGQPAAGQPEEKAPTSERRENISQRKRIDSMTPEEMQKELMTNHLTRLKNKRAYEEKERLPVQAAIDVDSLKWVNDNFGHEAGNDLLKSMGEALEKSGTSDAYHFSGDEFHIEGKTPGEIEVAVSKAREFLKEHPLTFTDKEGVQHTIEAKFSHGTGDTLKEAEAKLQIEKKAREASGDRAARGERPSGVVPKAAEVSAAANEAATSPENPPPDRIAEIKAEKGIKAALKPTEETTPKEEPPLPAGPGAKTAGTLTERKVYETSNTTGVSSSELLTKDATVKPEGNQENFESLRERFLPLLSPKSGKVDFQALQIDGKNANDIKGIAGIFGSKIQFFKSETPELRNSYLGFVDQKNYPDTVFLNINSPAPHLQLLGHEIMHQLQINDPKLFQDFINEIRPLVKNLPTYRELAKQNDSYVDESRMIREFTAEFMEHRFMDKKFWDGMIQKNPSVFSRVLQYVVDTFNKVKDWVENGRDIDKTYINDIDKARDVAVKTLTEYQEKRSPQDKLRTGPGAKTAVGIAETPSDLSQLTGTLENVIPRKEPSAPILPQISVGIQKSMDLFSKVKVAAENAWERFKTTPVFTAYDKIMGNYDLGRTEAGLDALKWGKDIQAKVPKSLQVAMTNYLDVGGDIATLKDYAARSKNSELAKGYADAANLPPDIKLLADNVHQYFESWLDKLQEAGVLGDHFIENYIKHIWGKENPLTKRVMAEVNAGLFRTNPSLARQRILSTYFEGEQLGFTPKDKRVGFLVAAYAKEASEAINARKAIKDMFHGKAKDGSPIIIPQEAWKERIDSKEYAVMDPERESGRAVRVFDKKEDADAFIAENGKEGLKIEPRDRSTIFITPAMRQKNSMTNDGRAYREGPNHPAFKQYVWSINDAKGNPIFFKGNALIHPDHYDNLSNALKHSAIRQNPVGRGILETAAFAKQTMLSLSIFHPVQLAIHAIGHTVDIFHLKDIDLSHPTQRLAVSRGLNIYDGDGMQAFSEGVYGGGLVDRIPFIGEYAQKLGQYTFQSLLPRLKMSMFLDAFERNKERYGKSLSKDQIASKTADQANAAFGGLNYRKMGRNPTFQDFLRISLLAPDFLEARLRFAGQSVNSQNKEQAAAMARLAAGIYIGSRIANKFLDDDYHWDRPLSVVYKGQEFALRSVPGDIIHAIIDPRSFIYHRLNPTVTRTLIEGLTGRDIYGKERDLQAQVKDLLVTHMPIPFQGPFRKGDQSLWESAVSSMGLSTFKYKTAAERELAHTLSLTIPQKVQDVEEARLSHAKAKMKEAIRNNKEISPEIMKEIQKLSPEQARRVMMDATRYTRFEDGFNKLSLRDAIKVWGKTRGVYGFGTDDKERQMAEFMIRRKYGNAVKNSPNNIASLTDSEKEDLKGILEGSQ